MNEYFWLFCLRISTRFIVEQSGVATVVLMWVLRMWTKFPNLCIPVQRDWGSLARNNIERFVKQRSKS